MSSASESTVWPVLHYDDTRAALEFFERAFGFRAAIAVPGEDGDIIHAEMRWPGGAFVFGSTKHVDGVHAGMRAGACYVVTDDVDEVHERALMAGAEIIQAPNDTAFGSGVPTRAFSARDPEGNLWTFGTYRGVPDPGDRGSTS